MVGLARVVIVHGLFVRPKYEFKLNKQRTDAAVGRRGVGAKHKIEGRAAGIQVRDVGVLRKSQDQRAIHILRKISKNKQSSALNELNIENT